VDEPVKVNAPELKEEPVEAAVIFSEIMPEPEGGLKAFYEFVGKNIKYPDLARRLDIEGRVTVQFIVEKDGSLTDIKVLKGIGGGCDEEALRVIGMAPRWHPGLQSRRPVRVRMSLPLVFRLNH
jgi:periplasmic protein TonB